MQATCSSCSHVVTVDEKNPKLPEGPFSVKCPKCQTPVRFPGRVAARPAAGAEPSPTAPAAPRQGAVPLKPTALPGERALVALDDKRRATEIAGCLGKLGYEVDLMSDSDGVRMLDQQSHVMVVMARTVAEGGALTCYQRLFLLNADLRRSFFLVLLGDEYTTGDGVQAFVVHGDMVIASPDAGTCEVALRDRLLERARLYKVFIDCKRKEDAIV